MKAWAQIEGRKLMAQKNGRGVFSKGQSQEWTNKLNIIIDETVSLLNNLHLLTSYIYAQN